MSSFCRVMIAVRGAVRRSESVCSSDMVVRFTSPRPPMASGKSHELTFQVRNCILSSQGQKEEQANGVLKWL